MKKCSNCGHMNNSRAKFCEECGTPLTKKVEKKPDTHVKNDSKTKNFAHSLMTESMSEDEKKRYERELRRGARFDEVEMLEIDDKVPEVDKKVLRPQELPTDDSQEKKEEQTETIIEEEKPKKLFAWFRKERKQEKPIEQKKVQPKNIHQEVEIPNLLDKVEVKEEKVVRKFERPEINVNEETPTLSQIVHSDKKEKEPVVQEKPLKEQVVQEKEDSKDKVVAKTSVVEEQPEQSSDGETKKFEKADHIEDLIDEQTEAVYEAEEKPEKGPKLATKEVVILNGHSSKPKATEDQEETFDLPKTLPVFSQHEAKQEPEKENTDDEKKKESSSKLHSIAEVPVAPKVEEKQKREVPEEQKSAEPSKEEKESDSDSNLDKKAEEAEMVATELKEQTEEAPSDTSKVEEESAELQTAENEIVTQEKESTAETEANLAESTDEKQEQPAPEVSENQTENETDGQVKETQFVRPESIQNEESRLTEESGEEKSRKIWPWLLAVILILALLGGGYFYGQKYYSKEEQINRFIKTLDTKQPKQIADELKVEGKEVPLNQVTIEPFVKLLKEDKEYTKNLKKYLLKAKSNEKSDSEDIYLKNTGKKYYLFNDYQFVLRPLDFTIHTNKKDATIWLEGKQVAKSGSEKYSATLGPVLPGKYTLVSKLQEKDTVLENEYPYALTRTNDQDLDKINLNLIPLTFTVKSNVKDAEVFVNQKQVGVLKDGTLEVGPISWREGSQLQLRKTLGSDVVKTKSVELKEKQKETYTLDFPEMLTMENTKQVASALFEEVGKAIKDKKYDYKKTLAERFVDGEKNSGYKNLAQYIETNRENKQLESIDFTTKMLQLTPKTAKDALGVFEVAIVKHYTSATNKDDEKMVQKYNTLFQGTEKDGKYIVQIKSLGTPETVVDKVDVAKPNTPEPTVDHQSEITESISPENQSAGTQSNANSGENAGGSAQSAGGASSAAGSEQASGGTGANSNNNNSGNTATGGSSGNQTDRNEGINYSSGFNTVNTNLFLDKMYNVFQNAAKNDGYAFEDAFATYFSGGKSNPDYQDFVNYIDLCRRRPDYAYVVLNVKVVSVNIGADGNVKVIYDITYETHYNPGYGKETRVETFRYHADMVNENGILKIKSLGNATKIYDNHANT